MVIVGGTDKTALVAGVVVGGGHEGLVTAAHQLLEDGDLVVEVYFLTALLGDAAHVAAAIERTEVAGVVRIALGVVPALVVKHHGGQDVQRGPLHVGLKLVCIGQGQRAELRTVGCQVGAQHGAQHTLVDIVVVVLRVGLHHVLTVVAEEHVLGNDVRANLQLHRRIGHIRCGSQCGTITAKVDGAFDDGGVRRAGSPHAQRHLLGIGTVGVEGIERGGEHFVSVRIHLIGVVDEVPVGQLGVVRQVFIVGIGVGAVAAAIDAALDAGVDAQGVAAEHLAGDVVAAIDVGHRAALDEQAGSEHVGEVIVRQVDGRRIDTVHRGLHVGHTAAAVDVLYH